MLTFCKFRALNMPRSFIESMKWIQGSAIKPRSFYLAHIGRCWCLCDLTHIPFCSAHHDRLYHRYEPIIDSHSFDSLMDSVDILPLSIAWPLSCSWFLSELGVPFCQPDTSLSWFWFPIGLYLDVIILGGCVLLEWCGYSSSCDCLFCMLLRFPFSGLFRLVGAFRFPLYHNLRINFVC